MKKLITLFFAIPLLVACKTVNNFYQGLVIDENNNPIKGVIVSELYRENQTETDENGYFKFERYSPNFLGDLVFEKEGYRTDTLQSVRTWAGEKVRYYFVTKDITNVRLERVSNNTEKH